MVLVEELIRMIWDYKIIEFGEFKLSSGGTSHYYIDLRRALSIPKLYRLIVDSYLEVLSRISFDVIAGIATGGLPWASICAYRLEKPLVYVRSERKGHGREARVEGVIESGLKAVVVDDVATTGSSIESAVKALREYGVVVEDAVVFVDREEGAYDRLRSLGVNLHSVLKASDILRWGDMS